jgi:tetratricopeptide (TPR) repeat protein
MLRVLAALLVLAKLSPALANPPASKAPPKTVAPAAEFDPEAQAKRHEEAARVAYELGQLDEAIAEWRASYALSPNPVLLLSIAAACWASDRRLEAMDAYDSFLDTADPKDPARAEAEKNLKKLADEYLASARAAARRNPGLSSAPEPVLPQHIAETLERIKKESRPEGRRLLLWGSLAAAAIGGGLVGMSALLNREPGNPQVNGVFERR